MLDIDRSKVEVPYETTFWGQKCTCDPRFVLRAFGDGDVLLGLQPLNTRPHYYVVRIDSSWHLDNCRKCKSDAKCPDDLREHLEEIYEAIEDEYGSKVWIEESNAELGDGEEPEDDGWPVFDDEVGTCWFEIDPSEYVMSDQNRSKRTA